MSNGQGIRGWKLGATHVASGKLKVESKKNQGQVIIINCP